MKKIIKSLLVVVAFITMTSLAFSQCKMDSDGKTLRSSSNSTIGKIDSDGKTIRNSSNSTVGKVDSDGKTIRNSSNSTVLKIDSDGKTIRNSSNSKIATMSDVLSAIKGAKAEAKYVALWWFLCKN
jgi:uncharacterized protein YxeA